MYEFDVNLKTIRQEIVNGNGEILDKHYSREFDDFISKNYPWVPVTGYKIDWDKVKSNYKRFKWLAKNEEDTFLFLKSTCLKDYKEGVIIYGYEEPCLLVKLNEYTCKNLLRFLPPGFGTRFLVGAKYGPDKKISLNNNCFIEIDMDLTDWLTASF